MESEKDEAIEAKLSHLLGSINFTISVYGTFESGKFYQTDSIDFDLDRERECVNEGRTFDKEELLARKLKRVKPVEALCFDIDICNYKEKEQAMDVLSQISDLFPDEIFDVKFYLTEDFESILPQYQAEYHVYKQKAADRKALVASEIQAILSQHKMIAYNFYNSVHIIEDPDTNSIPEAWIGKSCTGTIKFIFKFDTNRKSDFIKALDNMP